jgi:pimeloyl-ACP methyl ester carboxylesterase
METVTVPAGGARLAAEAAGQGTRVVLLHAGVADRRMWATAMKSLSSGYRCISYDRRGFGQTTSPDETFSSTEDLEAVMAHFGCDRAHLIGSSQGGRIAVDFALSNPEKVLSLVLVASALSGAPVPARYPAAIQHLRDDLEQAEAAEDIDRVNALEAHLWLDGPEQAEGRIVGPIRQLFLDMNGKALQHKPLTGERHGEPAAGRLRDITQPALVIWGGLDFPHVQQRSRHIAGTIPRARAFEMAGCAHLPNLEQPERFETEVMRFLDESSRPSP